MKKIYLTRVQQFNEVSYVGSIDPRILVRMADQTIEIGQVQEDQRPLEKKHIQEISEHVGQKKGLLPTSIIVGTKDKSKLTVEKEAGPDGAALYYMMIPSTEKELLQYANTVDISDGQHRVFAFSDTYRSPELKDTDIYEVPVSFYITPQLRTRQDLFYTTNAKQKPVPPNLLMWLRDKLDLLSKTEVEYLPLVRLLNSENISPLKGRIIMSAEKISRGYKAKEIVKILNKAKISEIGPNTNQNISDSQMVVIISKYLSGWEKRYQLEFSKPRQDTMTKISGLRYILRLLPFFTEISYNDQRMFDSDFVVETIKDLEAAIGVTEKETVFSKNTMSFRGESATIKQAEEDGMKLKAYVSGKKTPGFNPFA